MYVEVDHLTFSYKSDVPVLEEVSFGMEEGEILAILGPSGSGKSTLLRLLAGLDVPQEGSIRVNGTVFVNENRYVPAEKRKIGMVFQDYALFPHMDLRKNIAYGLKHLQKDEREHRIDEMLSLIDMREKKRAYLHELSGGQRQRAALARALAPNPKLMLLDEPFSNLDADLKRRIRGELRDIIKQTSMTSIVVTHDIEDACAIADRIVVMDAGRLSYKAPSCKK